MTDDGQQLRIEPINIAKTLQPGNRVCFTGGTTCGKTTAMISWLHATRKWCDICIVFAGSIETAKEFALHVPGVNIYTEWNDAHLEKVYEKQELDKALGKTRNLVLIVDDFAYAKKVFKSKIFTKVLFNGRHANITFFVSQQDALCLPKEVRKQFTFVVHCQEENKNDRERLYENYPGIIDSFPLFNKIMQEMTLDYGQLVLRNNGIKSRKLEENVWWSKAAWDPRGGFEGKGGHTAFRINPKSRQWKWHEAHYDKFWFVRKALPDANHNGGGKKDNALQNMIVKAKPRRKF